MTSTEQLLAFALAITWICFVPVVWILSLRITDAHSRATDAYWFAIKLGARGGQPPFGDEPDDKARL